MRMGLERATARKSNTPYPGINTLGFSKMMAALGWASSSHRIASFRRLIVGLDAQLVGSVPAVSIF